MTAWWLVVLLATSGVPDVSDPALKSAEPGEAAAAAYELYQNDEQDAACVAFVDQIRGGSADPWTFRGAAICAAEAPSTRDAVLAVLGELGDSHLVLFARGHLGYLEGDLVAAEESLRRAVDRAPDFALAWNVLGAVAQTRGDSQAAVPLIKKALTLAPELKMAQHNLERALLYAEVFIRLLRLFEDLPERLSKLPEPQVPISGLHPKEIISTSSEEDRQNALMIISALSLTPLEERQELIAQWLKEIEFSEIDLWWPVMVAQDEQTRNLTNAAIMIEAWFHLAEAFGRRDALLYAASMGINVTGLRLDPGVIQRAISTLTELPANDSADIGLAQINLSCARILSRAQEHERALGLYKKARKIFIAASHRLGQANSLRGEAEALHSLGRSEEALSTFREVRILYEAIGSQDGQGNALLGEATILSQLYRNEEASAAYREARALFEITDNRLGQGGAWNGEAEILFLMGNFEEAILAFERARSIFEIVGDRLSEGRAMNLESGALLRSGNAEEALTGYRKARKIFKEINSFSDQGNTLMGEAETLFFLGKYEEALSTYQEAGDIFAETGDLNGQGGACDGKANVLLGMGKIERALATYREAQTLFDATGNESGKGTSMIGEADVLYLLNENEAALLIYRKSQEIFSKINEHLGQGNALLGEAAVLASLGIADEALLTYQEARKHFEAIGDQLGQGNTFLGEADALLLLGENERSFLACRRAEEFFKSIKNQNGQGQTLASKARVLLLLENYKEAADSAANAAEILGRAGASPGPIDAIITETYARRHLGEIDKAIQLAQRAIDYHFSYRESFIAEHHRTELDKKISTAYDLLIPLLSRRPDADTALTRSEEARSRVLLDLLTVGRLGGEDAPLNLQQENERLHAKLARVGSKLRRETDPAVHHELLVERHVLDAELQRNLYRRVSAERQELEFGKSLDAGDIRGLAAEIGPILLFYAATNELLAFLVLPPPREVRLQIIHLDRKQLGDLVETFLFDLSNPLFERRARGQAEDLWRQLLAPLAEYFPPSGPLTLVPHGPLHELPFEALVIDPKTGQRLSQRWDVTVTPSVSALALARQRHQPPSVDDNLVAFAAGVGLNLPEVEIRKVAALFPTSRQATFGPTEAEFRFYEEFASQARHLLITTRGVHVEGSRRGTYLEIQPTEDVHDERLSAAEIAAIPIHAELVTLAACDTASGTALLSDERLTLVRSFLIAGATSVLATRWRIPEDQSATRFLQDFYHAYRRGGPQGRGMRKDEALTEARRLSIERGDPAQVWAAWVLVGDAR